MNRFILCFVGLLALGSVRAAAAAAPVIVPFEFEDSRIYVPVRARSGPPSWFILDTGVTQTILDRRFAQALNLEDGEEELATGAGAGASRQRRVGTVHLRVGPVALNAPSASVLDLKELLQPTSGRYPAGIIGSQFFREHVVEIDFRTRRLSIWPIGTDLAPRFARAVPLTFAEMTPLTSAELTLPSGQRLPEKVLVDLGAKSTLLVPEPFIVRNHLETALRPAVVLPLGAGVGGNTYYSFARVRMLALAGDPVLALADPVIGLSVRGTLRSSWHEGLLGADFLSRFRIAFDYARARLLLTRQSTRAEPLDRSGLFVVCAADCRQLLVRDVLAGGPGDRAGFRPGDELLAVDGRPAAQLSLSRIRQILKSRRPEIALVVRRGGHDLKLRVRLADLV